MLPSSQATSSAAAGFLRRTHSARYALPIGLALLLATGGMFFAFESSPGDGAIEHSVTTRRGHIGPARFPAYVVEIVSSQNSKRGAVEGNKTGLGVIYRPDGVIMTVLDAIDPDCELRVRIPGRGSRDARLLGVDRPSGVVLLKVDGWSLPTVEFGDSTQIRPGQDVFAVNPWRRRDSGRRSVNGCRPEYQAAVARIFATAGDASRDVCRHLLTLDFDSAPSERLGSAVVDSRGRLIALVSRKDECGAIDRLQRKALPANLARRIADHLLLSREPSEF